MFMGMPPAHSEGDHVNGARMGGGYRPCALHCVELPDLESTFVAAANGDACPKIRCDHNEAHVPDQCWGLWGASHPPDSQGALP